MYAVRSSIVRNCTQLLKRVRGTAWPTVGFGSSLNRTVSDLLWNRPYTGSFVAHKRGELARETRVVGTAFSDRQTGTISLLANRAGMNNV